MKGSYLGEFEELVLLMVGILNHEAYGINIVEEIQSRMNRKVNLSAIHITLYRLEDKGYVISEMGGASSIRGGRRKRLFKLTNAGVKILNQTQEKRSELWSLVPSALINS